MFINIPMSVTSFTFFFLFGISLFIYYVVPKKAQWIMLLLYSIIFYVLSTNVYTGTYLIASIIITHICVNQITKNGSKFFFAMGIISNAGILFVLKYSNFAISNLNAILSHIAPQYNFELLNMLAPLGISFYSLQVIGYIVDVYGGATIPEKNIFKTALFVGYYPQLTSGPIARHEEMKFQLFEGHAYNAEQIIFGMQRILWGVFKKLVIASYLGIMVDTIYADVSTYDGLFIWSAAVLFLIQLYADFSGCMDIIIGASECYGIILPENFNNPFLSRSFQEFWQRWHITLGGWLRDYIMYPLLHTQWFKDISKKIKSKWGRKASREIPSYMAMFVVWLLFGLWHGGQWKYVIGEGLLCFLFIVIEKLLTAPCSNIKKKLNIDESTTGWKVLQSVRVFAQVAFVNMFFRLDSLKDALSVIIKGFSHWNPWIFGDYSFYYLGVQERTVRLVFACVILLFIVDFANVNRDIRERIHRQPLIVKWSIWGLLLFAVLIFGCYGTGYDATSFIYGNF